MKIMITEQQAQELYNARKSSSSYTRKDIKKRIFASIRNQYGISPRVKFRVAVEVPDNPLYRIVRNKHTDQPLDDGLPDPVAIAAAAVAPPVAVAVGSGTSPAVSDNAKKAAAKAISKAISGVAGKKAPAKKAAKLAPAKKLSPLAQAKKVATAVVNELTWPREVRANVNGKRKYLGKAKDQREYNKMLKDAGVAPAAKAKATAKA